MRKLRLMSPGPTPIPPEVMEAMSRPILHHRTAEFEAVLQEVEEGLRYVFQTDQEVIPLASSGTGAMEAAVANLFRPGDRALVVVGGKFGERWAEICRAYGLEVVPVEVPWGRAVRPEQVAQRLDGSIRGVFVQASETSTGVKHPVREIAQLVRSREDTVLVVDAITALGVFELPMDAWGLDVVVCGSQKALMLPPGLAFVALSPKAWSFVERGGLPRYYFDLRAERESLRKRQTAFTPAISLLMGLRASLRLIREETLQGVFARHRRLAEATRRGVRALGLELLADRPAEGVTAVISPVDGQGVVRRMRERYGVIIAGGQARLKGKIFRISHMGYVDELDVLATLGALEMALRELGHRCAPGAAVGAALEYLMGEAT